MAANERKIFQQRRPTKIAQELLVTAILNLSNIHDFRKTPDTLASAGQAESWKGLGSELGYVCWIKCLVVFLYGEI